MAGSAEMQTAEMTKPALASGLCNNTCAGEARKPFGEVYMKNIEQISGKGQALGSVVDELRASFQRIAQPVNGVAVRGYDLLHGIAEMFGAGRIKVAVCLYGGGHLETDRIEVAGRAPRAALKGLRRVRWHEAPPALCWRQGYSGSAPLYALASVGQLADLLAEAGEVRQ